MRKEQGCQGDGQSLQGVASGVNQCRQTYNAAELLPWFVYPRARQLLASSRDLAGICPLAAKAP